MAASQAQLAGNTPKPTVTISSAHEDTITSIAWLPGDRIVTGSYDKTIRIWSLTDGTQEGSSMVHEEPVCQIVVTKDGRIVSRCLWARHLIVWNADTQQLIEGPWSNGDHGQLEEIALSQNEALLASCHAERIVFWEMVGTMRVRRYIPQESSFGGLTHAACLSPTGTRFAISYFGEVSVFDVESGELICGPFEQSGIQTISWSHDGARLFCGDGSGRGRIDRFNSETGEIIGEPLNHWDQVRCLSLSPNGKWLASCSEKGTARFWEVDSQKSVGEPLLHGSKVYAIAFSRTGEFFAAGGYERHISVWRVPWWDRQALGPLLDTSAVVSPDAGGPSNVADLDSLDVHEPRRHYAPQGHSIQNPSDDPTRVQSSVLPLRWWKRIARIVFRPLYPIYPTSGLSRVAVASSSTVDNNQRSHSSGHSSSEESPEDSSDTPSAELEPEVGDAGCCGLWSRPRTRATADRAREDAHIERSSHRTRPSESNNVSLPASTYTAMQDILELSAVVPSTDTP